MAIDFRIRDFFYPMGIYRLRRTLERTQWLAPEALRHYQTQRLQSVVAHAYGKVPYYRSLFDRLNLRPSDIKERKDLKKLPLLSKDIVRDEGPNLLAGNASKYKPMPYKTTGTSGAPLTIYHDRFSNILEFVYYWRHWSWAGYRLGDCFAELGSGYFLHRRHLTRAVCAWQPFLRRLMLNGSQISVSKAAEIGSAIRKYNPGFLKGMASTLYFLALCLKEAHISDIPFRAVFSTGAVLTPQYRETIESVFGCPVLDSYGHMERTVGISQCLEGGYHVHSDYGLLELDNSTTASGGQFNLVRAVGTSLYNMAMPLIRYDAGDALEVYSTPKRCPCGRTLPLIKAIHGRSEDTIVTPDGRFITAMFIVPELCSGIRFVQFIQDAQNSLQIHVVPDGTWNDERKAQLVHFVSRLTGPQMKIFVHQITPKQVIKDVSGKIRAVISQLNTR